MKKKPVKPGTAARKPAPKPWAPVPVAVQIAQHRAAVKAAHAKAAAKGRPRGFQPGGVMMPVPAARPAAVRKPVRRKLALGEAVACCAAEALAASLRLTGRRVSDADVLALYERTADGPDVGASILATLEAAAEYGLAGVHLIDFREVMPHDPDWYQRSLPSLCETRAGLILGADLPGPHALLDDGRCWWSWGEPHDPAAFPYAVIEEAWAVAW